MRFFFPFLACFEEATKLEFKHVRVPGDSRRRQRRERLLLKKLLRLFLFALSICVSFGLNPDASRRDLSFISPIDSYWMLDNEP